MWKLSVKLSFLVSVLAVSVALVESFIQRSNLSTLKLCLQLEDKQLPGIRWVAHRWWRVFSKITLSLQWPKSLLVSFPAEGAAGKGFLLLHDRLTKNSDQRVQCSVLFLLLPKESSAEFSVTVNSVWQMKE